MTEGTSSSTVLAKFGQQAEANAALLKLNTALTTNVFFKWAFRLFAIWVLWAIASSMAATSQAGQKPDTAANFVPPAPAQMQEFPSAASAAPAVTGSLSDQIYAQAMQAKAKAEHDNMPPRVTDNTDGLDAFGLDTGASSAAGPGCDPKLAFTVPDKNAAR